MNQKKATEAAAYFMTVLIVLIFASILLGALGRAFRWMLAAFVGAS